MSKIRLALIQMKMLSEKRKNIKMPFQKFIKQKKGQI